MIAVRIFADCSAPSHCVRLLTIELQPDYVMRPGRVHVIDLSQKYRQDQIQTEADGNEALHRCEPPRHLEFVNADTGEPLDHGLEKVPEQDADGQRHEEGAPIHKAGKHDAERDDGHSRAAKPLCVVCPAHHFP